MTRRVITSRRDLATVTAERKLTSPTSQRVRIATDDQTQKPRADGTPKRNKPLKDDQPKNCNKDRPKSQKGNGSGRKFAGRYC